MTLHPDEVLVMLKEQSPNPVRHRNLDVIHRICAELHAKNSQDFSITTIGRLSQERGGMSKQALYNQTSSYLRDLIKAWAGLAGNPLKKPAKPSKPLAESEWLKKIEDPAIRALIGNIIAERNLLRSQVAIQRKNTGIIIDCRPLPGEMSRLDNGDILQVVAATDTLTPTEKFALKKAISPNFLADEGWYEGSAGEIRNSKGRVLLDFGFANGVRKILNES